VRGKILEIYTRDVNFTGDSYVEYQTEGLRSEYPDKISPEEHSNIKVKKYSQQIYKTPNGDRHIFLVDENEWISAFGVYDCIMNARSEKTINDIMFELEALKKSLEAEKEMLRSLPWYKRLFWNYKKELK
jgi:hypothetical protein